MHHEQGQESGVHQLPNAPGRPVSLYVNATGTGRQSRISRVMLAVAPVDCRLGLGRARIGFAPDLGWFSSVWTAFGHLDTIRASSRTLGYSQTHPKQSSWREYSIRSRPATRSLKRIKTRAAYLVVNSSEQPRASNLTNTTAFPFHNESVICFFARNPAWAERWRPARASERTVSEQGQSPSTRAPSPMQWYYYRCYMYIREFSRSLPLEPFRTQPYFQPKQFLDPSGAQVAFRHLRRVPLRLVLHLDSFHRRVMTGGATEKGLQARQGDNDDGECHFDNAERVCELSVSTTRLSRAGQGAAADLQTRLGWPVPTLRVMKRTMVVAMVRAPRKKVRATPLEDLSTPWTSSARGSA